MKQLISHIIQQAENDYSLLEKGNKVSHTIARAYCLEAFLHYMADRVEPIRVCYFH